MPASTFVEDEISMGRMAAPPMAGTPPPGMVVADWGAGGQNMGRAAALQNYNLELVHRIEELREKREEIRRIIQLEEEEKAAVQKDLGALTKRLAELDDSLARKYSYSSEYQKTIQEVEAAYAKILESSKALLHVLKTEQLTPSMPVEDYRQA